MNSVPPLVSHCKGSEADRPADQLKSGDAEATCQTFPSASIVLRMLGGKTCKYVYMSWLCYSVSKNHSPDSSYLGGSSIDVFKYKAIPRRFSCIHI